MSDGLGLGLALVRGLCELHGGRVAVHSDGPGRGSEFAVRLPLLNVPQPDPEPPRIADRGPSRALKVLVVDDHRDGATSLAELLLLLGPYEVRVAHDGPSGLAVATDFRPDVALLDVAMPNGMDGYQLAERLRATPGLEGTVLMTLTGFGQDGDRERASEVGVTAHLVKPVDPNLLAELLAGL
jgi:CheY-like chemotaxis protein